MTESYFTTLTETGQAMFANVPALKRAVEFTTLVVGDGGGNYAELTLDKMLKRTNLVRQVWDGDINHIYNHPENANYIVCEAYIPPEEGDFTIREVGIKDPEGNLIAIGKYPTTYKPKLEQGAAKDLYIKMILEVTDSAKVTLRVDPTVVVATRQHVADELDGHNTAPNAHPEFVRQDDQGNVAIAGHVSIGGNKLVMINNVFGLEMEA